MSWQERPRRIETSIPAIFRTSETSSLRAAGDGTILNLSMKGCMIQGAEALPVNTDLVVHLYLRRDPPVPIHIERATIRWSHEGRFGLEFMEAPPESWTCLHEVMTTGF